MYKKEIIKIISNLFSLLLNNIIVIYYNYKFLNFEALHIAEITFTKWTVVISIFIIFGTIFYVTNVKNNNEKQL